MSHRDLTIDDVRFSPYAGEDIMMIQIQCESCNEWHEVACVYTPFAEVPGFFMRIPLRVQDVVTILLAWDAFISARQQEAAVVVHEAMADLLAGSKP
jgi:hypothetical protein